LQFSHLCEVIIGCFFKEHILLLLLRVLRLLEHLPLFPQALDLSERLEQALLLDLGIELLGQLVYLLIERQVL